MTLAVSDALGQKPIENIIENSIEQIQIEIRKILGDYKAIDSLRDIISDSLISSGKMVRTRLLLAISLMGNTDISSDFISQASAVEITHLASLIHDDIIDDSLLRRNHQSIQAKYGKDTAVFAGDFMIARVFSYLLEKNLSNEALLIANTIRDMCNGEVGQNLSKYKIDVSEGEYFRNISGKTASFFKAVCYFGAKNSKFNQFDTNKIVRFGENLGLMFQIKDDLLDIFYSKKFTGKEEFKDVKEGVYTYPVIVSLKNKTYGRDIREILIQNQEKGLDETSLERLKILIGKTDARAISLNKIKELSRECRLIVTSLSKDDFLTYYLIKILEKVEKS